MVPLSFIAISSGLVSSMHIADLLLNLNNVEYFAIAKNNIERSNFVVWTGLRSSIPPHLKNIVSSSSFTVNNPAFATAKEMFCVDTKKCKHYYLLLISRKAKFPNITSKLKINFNLSEEQLHQTYSLPHDVALEPYVVAY